MSFSYERTKCLISKFVALFVLSSSRREVFAKTSKCLVFAAVPVILASLFPGHPLHSADARRKCQMQFEDCACEKKLASEYLRSAFPCAFTVISSGFRHVASRWKAAVLTLCMWAEHISDPFISTPSKIFLCVFFFYFDRVHLCESNSINLKTINKSKKWVVKTKRTMNFWKF